MFSLMSSVQYVIIGLENSFALNLRQAIMWTNNGLVYRRIYTSLGLNECIFTISYFHCNLGILDGKQNGQKICFQTGVHECNR